MHITRTVRIAAVAGSAAVVVSLVGALPAHAAPGDWVNVSGIPSGSNYPEISTSAVPEIEVYGDDVQVAWSRADSSSSAGVYTAILDPNGGVKLPSAPIVSGWSASMSGYPQLLTYQGQRAVSFGGNRGGSSLGQSLATSGDGRTWTVNPGSLSASNLASTSSGGGTVNTPGETLIWAGAPNMGSLTWHVGLSSTNPAPAGSDQVFFPPQGSGVTGVNVVYEPTTNTTYAAYHYRGGDTVDSDGTFIARIHPAFSGVSVVPGSNAPDRTGKYGSITAGDIVPLAARPQGGVYVGYIDQTDGNSLKIREVNSGAVLAVPQSQDASGASLSAAPNGRLWVSFEKRDQMYTAQTDPAAQAFGAPAAWGTPQKGASIYGGQIKGDSTRAYVGINAYADREQNIFVTPVLPNLTVSVVGKARRGAMVKLRVLDGGAPVRNARVIIGGKAYKSKAGGLVAFKAPRSAGVKVQAKGPGYRDGAATIVLGR